MSGGEEAFVALSNVLRWLGLSFTRLRRSGRGDLVAEDSPLHLFANAIAVGVFLFLFWHEEEERDHSNVVYAAYVKFASLCIVAFLSCGNLDNRKFVGMVDLLRRTTTDFERRFGRLGGRRRRGTDGRKAFAACLVYLGVMTGLNLWTDAQLLLRRGKFFRGVNYFYFYYTTFFTTYFVVSMNHVKASFGCLYATFGHAVRRRRVFEGRSFGAWSAAFMELRGVEGEVNDVFGRQMFFSLLLAFSCITVNAYDFVTRNLYGKGYFWSNLIACTEVFQSATVVLFSTSAAESAANEANKIGEIIFRLPVHLHNWQMYSQVKYFTLFTSNHPVQFKAWNFYAISSESLFKVMLTSSAIAAIILQCHLLRGSLEASE